MSAPSRCRFCGAVGREAAWDPAPGVCPACLDERMARATAVLEATHPARRPAVARRLLRAVGLRDQAAAAFLAALVGESAP